MGELPGISRCAGSQRLGAGYRCPDAARRAARLCDGRPRRPQGTGDGGRYRPDGAPDGGGSGRRRRSAFRPRAPCSTRRSMACRCPAPMPRRMRFIAIAETLARSGHGVLEVAPTTPDESSDAPGDRACLDGRCLGQDRLPDHLPVPAA